MAKKMYTKMLVVASEPRARLNQRCTVAPVGFDGAAYIEDLSPHNELIVERPNGRRCTVAFDYQPQPGEIPSIGPLRCVEKKP
jgi:outer membrane usher protein